MTNREQDQTRKNLAYDLRLRGYSFQMIADELGIGKGTAHRWVNECFDEITLPLVDQIRKQEIDRLTRYLERLDERIEEGDDKSISLAIKISESLRKLLGVDVPVVQTVEHVEVSVMDLDIRRLIDTQKNANAEEKAKAAIKEVERHVEDQ